MKKLLIAAILIAVAPAAPAAQVGISANMWIDGTSVAVPVQSVAQGGTTYYQIGTWSSDGTTVNPWVWQNSQARVQFSGMLNPDPFISTGITVTNFGPNPASFLFGWSETIVPTGPQSVVKSTFVASFTDTLGDGFSFSPNNPNAAGAALTSSLGDGSTTINPTPGISIGPAFSAAASSPGTVYSLQDSAGFLPGPAGTWTQLGATLGFTLSGNSDVASINVFTDVQPVPLPGSLLLLLCGASRPPP